MYIYLCVVDPIAFFENLGMLFLKSIPVLSKVYKRFFLILISLTHLISIDAQLNPDYQFKSESLISGTALQVNAIYKFPNVKTGVDARVKITAITGGISLTDIDGTGGFDKALQPVIYVPAHANGYVELDISFYGAGTTVPLLQSEIATTPIDVDGVRYSGLPIYEYDQIQMFVGYTQFQFGGGELDMSFDGLWVTGKNNAAINYDGIDTLEKKVMFTTVNAAILSFKVRVGADNQSNTSTERLRSIYFQKFTYPYVVALADGPSVVFSARQTNNFAHLSGNAILQGNNCRLVMERSDDSRQFRKAGELLLSANGGNIIPFEFNDPEPLDRVTYYHVKMFAPDGTLLYTSKQVMMKATVQKSSSLSICNVLYASSSLHISLQSENATQAWLNILDLSGRTIVRRKTFLHKGNNSVDVSSNFFPQGKLIIVSVSDEEGNTYSKKINL